MSNAVTSPASLSDVAPAARRRMSLLLLPPATGLMAAGLIVLVRPAGVGWSLVAVLLLVLGGLLALLSVGLRRSAAVDEARLAEAQLDAALVAAAGACDSDCDSGACGVTDCAVRSLFRTAPHSADSANSADSPG